MKRIATALLSVYAVLLAAPAVQADTLYVAVPNQTAPGHPLRLESDHRAAQIGDLVAVQFDFATNAATSKTNANKKDFNVALGTGSGLAGIAFLRFPSNLGGGTGSDSSRIYNGTNTFVAAMMATVTDVLPSGNFIITGDQRLVIDGVEQTLHVVGTIREEDIDQSDTVLSSRVANVKADFKSDNPEIKRGFLQKVVDALF